MGILVKELPVWLQSILEKKLEQRMDRNSASELMNHPVEDLTEYFDPKQYAYEQIRNAMPSSEMSAYRKGDVIIAVIEWVEDELLQVRVDLTQYSFKILYRPEMIKNPYGEWELIVERRYNSIHELINNELRHFDINNVADELLGKE